MDYLIVHPKAVRPLIDLIDQPGTADEALELWEQGTPSVKPMGNTRIYDLGPVRDPAFAPREPNPIVEIRMDDGRLIYREPKYLIIWR